MCLTAIVWFAISSTSFLLSTQSTELLDGNIHLFLHDLQVCVFTAPLFSAFCSLAAYLLVKEIRGRGAGLTAAAFMAMVPSYISRSVAGSFDNEGVAIFALVFVFFLYVKV